MAKQKTIKIPKQRRKYYQIYGLDGGLDYSKGSTFIGDTNTPSCREMMFRYSKASKVKGTNYFGSTNTTPLLDQIMHFDQYYKTTGSGKLIAHTISNVYAYNTGTSQFENITRGLVVEDCEDRWYLGGWDVVTTAGVYAPDHASEPDTWTKTTAGTGAWTRVVDTECVGGYRMTQTSSITAATNTCYYSHVTGGDTWVDSVANASGYVVRARLKVVTTGTQGATEIVFNDDVYDCTLHILSSGIGVTALDISEATQTYAMDTTDAYHIYEIVVKSTALKIYVDGTERITGTLDNAGGTPQLRFGDAYTAASYGGVTYWDYVTYQITDDTRYHVLSDITTTYKRKDDYALVARVETPYTTGIATYETLSSVDLSGYTYLRFFIMSDIDTVATDLDIRISEQDAGGVGADYADYSVPALTAGVWKEVSVAFTGATTTRDNVDSVSLIIAADKGAQTIYIDDITATIQTTGDEDDSFTSEIMNNYYVYSNNILPLTYWDMATDTTTILYTGCVLAAKAIRKFGERLCLYHVTDNSVAKPQRVQWTIVGGLTTTPVATDWTNAGSGDTDLEGTMGSDFIQNAEKLGNYMVIYGERTIALQEYVGVVTDPFAFYTRVTGVGLAAPLAIANLGNEHIFLGWDNIYSYKGGKEVLWVGDEIKKELFTVINPEYIHRSFMVYLEEIDEIRLYVPTGGNTLPDTYFSYNLSKKSWSRGVRSYTSFGYHTVATAVTWASVGDSATATWDEQTTRWNDTTLQALAPLTIYGDSSGIVRNDDYSEYNLDGVAIDAWVQTKDFVTGDGYRRTLTNWMELQFEAIGHSVDVSYSTDLGVIWSDPVTFDITSTSVWEMFNYDFEANAPQIRFKFRNANTNETFEVREIELGYLEASDRGI